MKTKNLRHLQKAIDDLYPDQNLIQIVDSELSSYRHFFYPIIKERSWVQLRILASVIETFTRAHRRGYTTKRTRVFICLLRFLSDKGMIAQIYPQLRYFVDPNNDQTRIDVALKYPPHLREYFIGRKL